jgi:hypothetical protein
LADHLERARGGEVVIDPTMATQITRRAARQLDQRWPGSTLGLSQRESQVLGLLADGLSNASIASELLVGEGAFSPSLGGIVGILSVILLTSHEGPLLTGTTTLYQFFGYFGLFCATVLILRVLVAVVRDGIN